jgi:hypothetical protein
LKNQVQGKMANTRKKRAPTPPFVSRNQLVLEGFESPFDKKLNPENRWVVLSNLIPWDEICNIYLKAVPKKETDRPGLNPRIVLGSIIIKHLCDIDDRETVDQIYVAFIKIAISRMIEVTLLHFGKLNVNGLEV